MNEKDPTRSMLLDHGTALVPVDDPRHPEIVAKYAAWRARNGYAVGAANPPDPLADFTTDELAAELQRRADKPSQERP